MIAAVCPYFHGRAALVCGSVVRTWEVGRLVCREHGDPACKRCAALQPAKRGELRYKRDVGPADVMALVGEIEDAGRELGAHHYITERVSGTGTEAQHAGAIVAELVAVLDAETADLPASADRSTAESRARTLAKGDEHGKAVQEVRRESSGPRMQGAVHEGVQGAPRGEGSDPASGRIMGGGGDRPIAGDVGGTIQVSPASTGTGRVAGIDPGQRFVAVAALDASGCVAARTFDVGRVIPLDKPRVVTRKDGTTREITVRREVTDDDVERLLGDVAEYLAAHGATRIAVERATHFHAGKGAEGAQAAGLARAQWIGGEIAGMLRGQGYAVTTCSSATWRSPLKRGGVPWQQGLAARLPSLPTGEHIADAAGVALTLLAPPRAPKVPRVPGAKRKRSKDAANEKRRAEGCTGCEGRCRAPCPRAVAANQKRAASMRGNTNACRGVT
jgi:hypothetical protein